MSKKPLVSIIIVNWNGGEVFEKCLRSLSKLTYPNWELVVVDNGSNDGSEKSKINKKYKLVRNKKNLGFAEGNNIGFKYAKGKYILLLNNDTKVPTDLLDKLVDRMSEDNEVGVIQPKILLMDKPNYLDNAGSFLTMTGLLQHWGYMAKDSEEFNKEREIFSAKGACMLIRRNVIEKAGLFDSNFGSYFEESDFCWRVWLSGMKVVYYPATYIYHKVGFTSKKMNAVDITYNSNKNRIMSLIKNLDSKHIIIIFIPHLIFLILLSIYYFLRLQLNKVMTIWKAFAWNIFHIRSTLGKRQKIQKLRKISDGDLFKIVMVKTNIKEMFIHFTKVEKNFK